MTAEPAVVAPKKKRAWWKYALGLLFTCGAIVVAIMASGPPTTTPGGSASTKAGVTKAAFDKVKTGMPCSELAGIFGSEGTVSSEAGEGEFKMIMYTWQPNSFSGASAVVNCTNGKVDAKTQIGLK